MDLQRTDRRLADYVRPLLARKWMILLAVIVATGGVYLYYSHKPNVYASSTLVYVLNQGDPVTGAVDTQPTDRQVDDEATLLDARSTAALVAAKIGYHGSAGALLQQVSITSQPGVDFVQVSAHDGTAAGAAQIANGFAQEFTTLVNGENNSRIAIALRLSRAQLAQLGSNNPNASLTRSDLISQIDRLKLAQKDPLASAQIVQPAPVPGSPSSPKPLRNALFALALSLLAGIGAAFALERFDRRLKNPEEMEQAYGRTLLAVLPHAVDSSPARPGEMSLSSGFREPFRVLRTNIELETLDTPPKTIVVSSAMPGEGKSTVVRNLALAFRESGKTVAVVDLDLRHPSLQRMFSVPNLVGVSDVLRHELDIEDALVRVPVALDPFEAFMTAQGASVAEIPSNGHASGHNGHGARPVIALLPTGALPANPPAVLASERLAEVLDILRARFDVVIIDSAPLLAVSDTVPLMRYADATLFVGRMSMTTRDTAKRLMDVLSRVPDVKLAGVVANDMSRLDASGYGYGYGYGGYGQGSPGSATSGGAVPSAAKQPA